MSELAIEARALCRRFGPVTALRPLDLAVPRGASLAVLGPNGAGKSTLLHLLAGLARPSGGSLSVGSAGADRVARRRQVGLIAHQTFLYAALSARENLWVAARLHGLRDGAARAERLLAEQELLAVADRPAGTFSRGMAQRLSIARALVHDPAILLLDEPFTGLDPRAAEALAARLVGLREAGRTLVLVTHDLSRAAAVADRALVLVRGAAAHLPREAIADPSLLEASYRGAVVALSPGRTRQ